ncbi:MAG: hypothetical protein IJG19_06580 [Methanobrevibacter sp.]|nr:hypothetical protein [Methanobrevibacter sp.]
MKLFYWIYFILFLILVTVYIGAWVVEKRKERKARKDFERRQERYRRML